MRDTITILTFVLICNSCLGNDPQLEALVERSQTAWSAPGMAIVVIQGDRVLLRKGFGTRDHAKKHAMTDETLVPIGSCTKAFTSAAIASLVEGGTLAFDDPVRKHLPSFKLADHNANALVTLRDLLSHRTGLNGHDLLWYRAPWTLESSVSRIGALELSGPFRGSFHYSSLTVAAAGMAAAKRTNKSWEDLIRERIVKPLDLKRVAFTTRQAAVYENRADGFQRNADGAIVPMPAYEIKEPHPAGSLHLSIREFESWLKYQLSHASDSLAETKRPQTVVPLTAAIRPYHPHGTQVSYGMGWLIYDYRGKLIVAHGGMIDGFRTQVTLLPEEKIGIAIVNNLHDSKLNLALTTSIIDRLLSLPETDWNAYYLALEKRERDEAKTAWAEIVKARRADVKPSMALGQYSGEYRKPGYGIGTITVDNGGLLWTWSSFRCPLEHWEGDRFRITEGLLKNRFVEFRVRNGRAEALGFAEQIFERK
jgi:CubicO group peptidase (beta-lactamase class C family)